MKIGNFFHNTAKLDPANLGDLVEGEKLGGKVVRRMENGMYLINLRGKTATASMEGTGLSEGAKFRAEVVRNGNQLELRIVTRPEEAFNTADVKRSSANVSDDGDSAIFRLNKNTFSAKPGDKILLNILKTLPDGSKLFEAKGGVFRAMVGETLLTKFSAQVLQTEPMLELAVFKSPMESLNTSFVKSQVGGFDLGSILKSTGKFSSLNLADVTPDKLKEAVRNSGLFMENKLMSGESVEGDEKFRAIAEQNTAGREAITRTQIANVILADGLVGFLKTADDKVSDAKIRFKKDEGGDSAVFISMSFSRIGDTFISIRQVGTVFDVLVKSEKDISDELKELDIENTLIRWKKYEQKDEAVFNVRQKLAGDMDSFDIRA
ncbi:hypothetical protein [Limisalsivibrio acetivorans]|uniref:hypothetical protein n=1 Tax=Limisalsivibrio acetivorans TaxID=1304888 RepID=UPI0003B3084F|nr:hypothetical protein [Limisalsivibrio acetivorans]